MIPYLLKLSLSLALLLGGYFLLFRNDKRFLFNRFYLLLSLIFSLVIPFVSLPQVLDTAPYFDDSHLQFSSQILANVADSPPIDLPATSSTGIKPTFLLYFIYGTGVLMMAFRYAKHLWEMRDLLNSSEPCYNSQVQLRLTEKPVAPFSFGRYVVVNKEEYVLGKIHEDIIQHEYLHVRHRHTLDILLIEFLLIFYWFHPLVWGYRRALIANHEFCADNAVIHETADIASYSHTLVDFMQQQAHPHLGSGFRYSLTKHRILMMQRSASSAFAFTNKVLLTAIVVMSFLALLSFTSWPSVPLSDDSVFTVVIDAGHGGSDAGVTNANGDQEKELVLAIAQAISKQLTDPSIRVVFTRESDNTLTLRERVEVAAHRQANLFLSLHINQHNDQNQQGVEVYYSAKNPQSSLSEKYSRQFARHITLASSKNASVKTADFLVLRETDCPALLLNLGYLSNPREAEFLVAEDNQQQLASQIVQAIAELPKE